MTDKVNLMLEQDSQDLDYLRFNFGCRSFSKQRGDLRKRAIEARVDFIHDVHGARKQFDQQFKQARTSYKSSFNHRMDFARANIKSNKDRKAAENRQKVKQRALQRAYEKAKEIRAENELRTMLKSYLKANGPAILEIIREEALMNLTDLKIQVEAVHRWVIMFHVWRILQNIKHRYFKKVVIFRIWELQAQRARFVSERFRFWTIAKYGSLDKKHLNKMRHELIFNGVALKTMAEWRSKKKILGFLAATHRYKNFIKQVLHVRNKILKMQERGRKLFAMNQVRMNILRKMWKDQKAEMLKTLRLGTRKDKKRRTKLYLDIPDEVRDLYLGEYYGLCKRKAATTFIEWRMSQAELLKVPGIDKTLRHHRLSSHRKFDMEQLIFEKYRRAFDKNKVMADLMDMELKIQSQRKVGHWQSLDQLLDDPDSAKLYTETYLQRHRKNEQSGSDMEESAQQEGHVDETDHTASDTGNKKQQILTPYDFVKEKQTALADRIELRLASNEINVMTKEMNIQEEPQSHQSVQLEEDKGQDEAGQDGVNIQQALEMQEGAGLQSRLKLLKQQINMQRELVEQGALLITDDMVFPPTFIYLPSKQILTILINKAIRAKKVNGQYTIQI